MKPATTLHRVVLRADQALHLGTGRGSGFSGATHRHIPGSTLRGALCAAWWRDHPDADQSDFDARVALVSFGDAVPGPPPGAGGLLPLPVAAALDRRTCKYPRAGCPPTGHPWTIQDCPHCGGRTEPAKGERVLPEGARVSATTRVALTAQEQARDKMLFERQGLVVDDGTSLVALAAGDIGWLAQPGGVVRVGAAGTVAGRVTVSAVEPIEAPPLTLEAGENRVRAELVTSGVYVDDFGFATDRPTPEDIHWAFGLPDDTDTHVEVETAFVRWTTASGWHAAANGPKPEDAAVVAHSCFHLRLTVRTPVAVPTVVHDLGLRTGEGYGWAWLAPLAESVPASPPELTRESAGGRTDA